MHPQCKPQAAGNIARLRDVPVRTSRRVRATGGPFDVAETHVWTVEEGKVTRFESYIDTPKTREALGL